MIAQPHGILLVTGPTGSGKTTTLYAMLTQLNEVSRNILTIEDPIEYDLPGIGQTQVNPKVDMTFAKGLRAILRQDPDVVMIGEIRDLETADISVQASLTGHLVLSTLHTNTALGALARLHDMGVESFLLSSSIIGVLAQRLVRLLCPHCKTAKPIWESLKSEYANKTINGSVVTFTEVNCTEETAEVEKMMNQYNVEGYPTFKLLKDGQVIEYDAKPNRETLVQFLNTVA
jgi:type II secretory ATPase GspE/PulE/Tfp pilus assembly ATPase PilB-like protein